MCTQKRNIYKNTSEFIKFIGKQIYIFKARKCITAALCVGVALIVFGNTVMASQTDKLVGFSIKSVKNDKQVNKKVSYFDLLLSPGDEQVLEVDIFNTSDEPMEASITANTAGTNSGGVIDYDKVNVTDDSLKAAFEDLANVENPSVTIPANSSSRVRINVKMPDEAFDGVMLGGIVVKKIENDNADIDNKEKSTSIQNEYCYILGVKIRVNDTIVSPDFQLRYVAPKLSNHHTSIAANLQNHKAAIVKGLEIDAGIYYNNDTQPLYTSTSSNFDVAPNSNFDYIIPCSGKLSPGNYRLLLTATLEEEIWEFDESFTITSSDANEINEKAVNISDFNYYKLATICLALLLIIVLVVFIVYKKKSKNNKNS